MCTFKQPWAFTTKIKTDQWPARILAFLQSNSSKRWDVLLFIVFNFPQLSTLIQESHLILIITLIYHFFQISNLKSALAYFVCRLRFDFLNGIRKWSKWFSFQCQSTEFPNQIYFFPHLSTFHGVRSMC